MRRLLLSAAVAVAALAAPANATCTGTEPAGVCATLMDCRGCPIEPVVDPYCHPEQPYTGACVVINDIYVELPPR